MLQIKISVNLAFNVISVFGKCRLMRTFEGVRMESLTEVVELHIWEQGLVDNEHLGCRREKDK